jgi:putative transposase
MPRANRHFIPGHVWHITHRCHKKEFLLKFEKDKSRWLWWLFEAKKRYGACIFDYVITSNHIHLLLYDRGTEECIPRTIQLIAGRTGQEFNQRKGRQGAFWEDRYHATAVETNDHLVQCIVYIDLNMVRAGVVAHPSEWRKFTGYNEIQNPRKRYALIDHAELITLLGFRDFADLIKSHAAWVDEALKEEKKVRDGRWTESVAVGSKEYVGAIKEKLGALFLRRRIEGRDGQYELREPQGPYHNAGNTFPWQGNHPDLFSPFP